MKATEKENYRFGSNEQPRGNFSYFNRKFEMNNYGNQGFIVPWQLSESRKKEFAAESFCG